jgi:hypothetical protein
MYVLASKDILLNYYFANRHIKGSRRLVTYLVVFLSFSSLNVNVIISDVLNDFLYKRKWSL